MATRTPHADPAQQRRRDLAAIHLLATQLGLDTADPSPVSTYRTMLQVQGGKASAAELDELGRRRVLAYLRKHVGKPRTQEGFIRLLWRQLGDDGALKEPGEAGLSAFLHAQVGRHLVTALTAREGAQVIEALKAWLRRHQAARKGAA